MENDSMADREPTLSHHSDRWRDAGTQARSERPPGRAGFIWWSRNILDSLDAISRPGIAPETGPRPAGDLANFADGGAELYFFDTKDV